MIGKHTNVKLYALNVANGYMYDEIIVSYYMSFHEDHPSVVSLHLAYWVHYDSQCVNSVCLLSDSNKESRNNRSSGDMGITDQKAISAVKYFERNWIMAVWNK